MDRRAVENHVSQGSIPKLVVDAIVTGLNFPEPIEVLVVKPMGTMVKIIGRGIQTGQSHQVILSSAQIEQLTITPPSPIYDGDPAKFKLAIEALRLALAYEYDPYFSLSIARVDPLPHQLEAVYEYFMRLPRIRFLLADDPGAGKTIMAGLLIKELKIRGLVKRILVITPANLTFQWQRELKDKFREQFEVIRSDVLRANYGSNPWQEKNQVVTSVSWVSRVEDAKDSLLRSQWDLVIVDEAHKMSAYSSEKKTLAYQLGESLSQITDHFLLMTATPHKGDPDNFSLFLQLLDRDVYGDVKSLEAAMTNREAPFYLRRVKEALVTFPDPKTGRVQTLFTKRNVTTSEFQITEDELDFYDRLTRYVEDQSIKAAADDSARGRALAFTMAMLQRRFASSLYAVRRSLERMKDKRERILKDPEGYRREQMARRLPDDFEDLTDEEQQEIITQLEEVVVDVDPIALREEIAELTKLIAHARELERREIETKLVKLKDLLQQQGIFSDPKMKLLIFTEHKDTLDYLAGDGKENRPTGKLREWGLTLAQIHGGMKIGDRDTPGSRIHAEREFRESCQVLVATEAAGEGINLQFCWLMINYDVPWNPMRLEQRMGRIHRYGQDKDCLIFNFVSTNTREGRVLHKLFERIEAIQDDLDPKRTGKIFNVLGDVFPANNLEKMLRDMYAHNQMTEELIKQRIVEQVDRQRFESITNSTLEGLAKRELNLSVIIGKTAEAKERRLVPEVIEDFFLQAAPVSGLTMKPVKADAHIFKIGRVPRNLWPVGDRLEPRFGKLGRDYGDVVFDKELLKQDSTLEWVTPGHALFEAVREDAWTQVHGHLQRGAIFYDLQTSEPYRLDLFSAAIKDGRGNTLNKRLFAVQTDVNGQLTIRQPTAYLDIVPGESATNRVPDESLLPDRSQLELVLLQQALEPMRQEAQKERAREISVIARHVEISLNEILHRENMLLADLISLKEGGSTEQGIDGRIKISEDKVYELDHRLQTRRRELNQEKHCAVGDILHLGRSWVFPHPDRAKPSIAPMISDPEIERIAIQAVIAHEEAQGRIVQSVEADNRGFDLISRLPHPEDPQTALDVRFIEVKGRSATGDIALTANEYKTAQRLKKDYWLYVVFHCETKPSISILRDPGLLEWQPIIKVEHYKLRTDSVTNPANLWEGSPPPYGADDSIT
jgi:superfamily II DNA or RNA helicase